MTIIKKQLTNNIQWSKPNDQMSKTLYSLSFVNDFYY